MAIEDAVVLAEMLASSTDGIEEILQSFEKRRMPRARLVYETGVAHQLALCTVGRSGDDLHSTARSIYGVPTQCALFARRFRRTPR